MSTLSMVPSLTPRLWLTHPYSMVPSLMPRLWLRLHEATATGDQTYRQGYRQCYVRRLRLGLQQATGKAKLEAQAMAEAQAQDLNL